MAVKIMSGMEYVKYFKIESEDNVYFKKFADMYMEFLRKGVAGEVDARFVPRLENIRSTGVYVDKKQNPNHVYGGQTEVWIAVARNKPVAFVTAQHYISYNVWKDKQETVADYPEVVYIAHIYSAEKGMGSYLLQFLCANAWKDCTLCLEVEHGIADPNKLMAYYQRVGFMRCADLPATSYWRYFFYMAAVYGHLTVRLRGPPPQDMVLIEPNEYVCMPNNKKTWFIRLSA